MKRLRAVLIIIALLGIYAIGYGLVLHLLYGAFVAPYVGLQ